MAYGCPSELSPANLPKMTVNIIILNTGWITAHPTPRIDCTYLALISRFTIKNNKSRNCHNSFKIFIFECDFESIVEVKWKSTLWSLPVFGFLFIILTTNNGIFHIVNEMIFSHLNNGVKLDMLGGAVQRTWFNYEHWYPGSSQRSIDMFSCVLITIFQRFVTCIFFAHAYWDIWPLTLLNICFIPE